MNKSFLVLNTTRKVIQDKVNTTFPTTTNKDRSSDEKTYLYALLVALGIILILILVLIKTCTTLRRYKKEIKYGLEEDLKKKALGTASRFYMQHNIRTDDNKVSKDIVTYETLPQTSNREEPDGKDCDVFDKQIYENVSKSGISTKPPPSPKLIKSGPETEKGDRKVSLSTTALTIEPSNRLYPSLKQIGESLYEVSNEEADDKQSESDKEEEEYIEFDLEPYLAPIEEKYENLKKNSSDSGSDDEGDYDYVTTKQFQKYSDETLC